MPPSTKLEEKLEGTENFWAWKYRIGLILQENDIDEYIKEEVSKPEEAEAKEKHKKDMIRVQRIIADYQGSLDPSSVIQEDSKINVWCPIQNVWG